eukprot:Rmarinus@m.8414
METASRFNHLLAPIRDLAQNWSIDIAAELEDYLHELDKLTFTFDGGVTNLNFAEAALLLQGSACVYSRKVEYLYDLICRALEMVMGKKADKPKNSQRTGAGAGAGEDDEENFFFEEAFLPLDDDALAQLAAPGGPASLALKADTRASNKQDLLLVRPPVSLQTLEEDMIRLEGTETECRMQNCALHPSGALLLDPQDRLSLDGALSRRPYDGVAGGDPYADEGFDGLMDDCAPDFGDGDDFDDDDGGNDDGPDILHDDSNEPLREGAQPPTPSLSLSDELAKLRTPQGSLPRPEGPLFTGGKEKRNLAADDDPWAPLDPDDDSENKTCQFRKGATYRRPTPTQLCRAAQLSLVEGISFSAGTVCAGTGLDSRRAAGVRRPTFTALTTVQRRETQRRRVMHQTALRASRQQASLPSSRRGGRLGSADDSLHPVPELNLDTVAERGPAGDGPLALDDDGDSFSGGGSEAGGDDFGGLGDDDGMDMAPLDDSISGPGLRDEDEMARRATEIDMQLDAVAQNDEAVMLRLAAMREDLDEAAVARRVLSWQGKIQSVLENEDERVPFDIYAYGERLIQASVEEGERDLSFREMLQADLRHRNLQECGRGRRAFVQGVAAGTTGGAGPPASDGTPKTEVCRMFLAALQLTNNGNFDIIPGDTVEEPLRLHLLTTVPRYDMADPSKKLTSDTPTRAAGPSKPVSKTHQTSQQRTPRHKTTDQHDDLQQTAPREGDQHATGQARRRRVRQRSSPDGKPGRRKHGMSTAIGRGSDSPASQALSPSATPPTRTKKQRTHGSSPRTVSRSLL